MKDSLWKRSKAKEPLLKMVPSVGKDVVFLYKEINDEICIRCSYLFFKIKKSQFKTHLDPIITKGKIEETTLELSNYLDEKFIKPNVAKIKQKTRIRRGT